MPLTVDDLDLAIDRACYDRMILQDSLHDYKRLHRMYRMWLTADIRKRYGVRSWKKIHPVDIEDAVYYVQRWSGRPYRDDALEQIEGIRESERRFKREGRIKV